jgi:tetrahydromethanopterin S-methyltransferase subunit F
MSLPGHIDVGARLKPGLNSRRNQGLILIGFIGFQALDTLTTHLGLALQHQELNRIMAPLITTQGELVAYAVKGTAIAILLALLMMMYRRKPLVWHAYHVAAWLTALGVIANLVQLL